MEATEHPIALTELVDKISRKYHISNDTHLAYAVKHSIKENPCLFYRNEATMLWELKQKENYLYVADNKRFQKIRDAMLFVFSKRVNSGSEYFAPSLTSSEFDTISEDQKFWFERPKANADYEADNKLRYVFAHEKDGYRFTGLFKFVELKDDRTRVYELIDDKVAIANELSHESM